ncbi:MAG: hypothetical protein CM15mP79_0140 [Methanobacteriota archaeon]|nr:MAG: hypothetical protein CM15mP79_0140 [Euryarchaeota archaeon]
MDAVELIGWMLAALSIAAIVWMVRAAARRTVRLMLVWLRETCRCSMTPTWTLRRSFGHRRVPRFNPGA